MTKETIGNLGHDESKPNVFDKFIQPALEKVKEQTLTLPCHHNQTYDYLAFFRTLIYFFTTDIPSLNLFINTYLKKGLLAPTLELRPVAYTTFGEAFERFSVSLFREVFEHLLETLKWKSIPELEALGKLYCIDGSLFPVITNMLWAKYTSKPNRLKIHLCFDLNRMIPVNFIIDSGNSSERNALRKMLEAGITYIADRGYMCFQLFNDIQEARSYFVFRVKNNLDFLVIEPLIVQLPITVQHIFSQVTDNKISCNNDKSNNTYRLVRFQIGNELYHIMTNRFDLSTFQIISIYAYRWQIELLFRFLKRTMNGIHLIKNDKKGVTIQFYALLITALLQLHLKQELLEEIENREIENNNKKLPINESTTSIEIEENHSIHIDCDNQNELPVNESTHSTKPLEKHTFQVDNLETSLNDEIPSAHHFINLLGSITKKSWKISVSWLKALISLLDEPFDQRAIEILGEL